MSKQVALERELAQLTHINEVISRLIESIDSTNKGIHHVNDSITNTNALMFKWIQILSQTSYTRDIINNSTWNGEDMNLLEKYTRQDELQRQLEALEKENDLLEHQLEEPVKRRKF